MRCPDCNKFVSFDSEQEPELDLTVDDEGVVTGTARIVNCCEQCGQELKEATLDVEIDLSADFMAHIDDVLLRTHKKLMNVTAEARKAVEREHRPELLSEEGSRTDRTQTKDRHGRPIKRSRYMRRYYGADVTVTVGCTTCSDRKTGGSFELTGTESVEVQASGMDELV